MIHKSFLLIPFFLFQTALIAQKQVLSIPFEFERGSDRNKEYTTYYLADKTGETSVLVLKDNVKISYILFDKNLKIIKRIDKADLAGTGFDVDGAGICGGSGTGKIYNFAFTNYTERERKFSWCTVDFGNRKVVVKSSFSKLNAGEKDLVMFSHQGSVYFLTALDGSHQVKLRMILPDGMTLEKEFDFPIPSYIDSKVTVSHYLSDAMYVGDDASLTLPQAKYLTKVYVQDGKVIIVANWNCRPNHVFTINPKTMTAQSQLLNPFPQVLVWSPKTPLINGVLLDNHIFSFIVYKDKFQLSVHDLASEKLLKIIEIDKDFTPDNFSEPVMSATKSGKGLTESEVKKWEKEFKNVFDGDQAMIVRKNPAGYYELTFGIHRSVPISYGGGPAFDYTYKFQTVNGTTYRTPTLTPNASQGPMKLTYDADHYKQVRFRLDLDVNTLNILKGPKKPPVEENSDLRHYLDKVRLDKLMPGQFTLNNKDYVSYYDRDNKQYIIEEVIK